MIPKTDMDYVVLHAGRLKEDNRLFVQQKVLIESQLHSSSSLFRGMFGIGKGFRLKARRYLLCRGLI
jgi:hypothetical protein